MKPPVEIVHATQIPRIRDLHLKQIRRHAATLREPGIIAGYDPFQALAIIAMVDDEARVVSITSQFPIGDHATFRAVSAPFQSHSRFIHFEFVQRT